MSEPNMSGTGAPPRPERFRIHIVSVGIFILASLRLVFAAMARGSNYIIPGGLAAGIGECLGMLLIASGFGWVTYRVFGRSNLLGNLMFIFMILITSCGSGGGGVRQRW